MKLTAIFDTMSDAIYVADRNGRYTFLNKAAKELFNYAEIRKLGDIAGIAKYYDLEDREITLERSPVNRVLKGEQVHAERMKMVYGDITRYISVSGTPMYDEYGLIEYAVISGREITDLVEKENTIRKQKDQLQKTEIENFLKDRLLADITHAIRSPVASMVSLVELLEEEKEHYWDSNREIIDAVREQVKNTYNLVEKLLEWLKNRKERLYCNPRACDVFPAANEAASSCKLFVYCLGAVEIKYADGETVLFGSSKCYELLAYLLLKKGRFVSKWSIMENIFQGMPRRNAETYLNTTVYKLRKTLEGYGMKSAIISANESYKIEIRDIYADFLDFEDRMNGLQGIDSFHLEEALKTERLFLGELFGEKDYYWSLPERERLSDMYADFAKKLAARLLECSRLSEALQVLKKAVKINELDEEVNCLLLRVHAAQGDRVSLEKQFKRYMKVLQRELGVAPGRIPTNLYNALVKSFEHNIS